MWGKFDAGCVFKETRRGEHTPAVRSLFLGTPLPFAKSNRQDNAQVLANRYHVAGVSLGTLLGSITDVSSCGL